MLQPPHSLRVKRRRSRLPRSSPEHDSPSLAISRGLGSRLRPLRPPRRVRATDRGHGSYAQAQRKTAMSSMLTRRKLLTTTAAGASTLGASCFPRPALSQPVKVRYTLSWLPTGQYAFIYSARRLGVFKKRGIDLDISPGFGSLAAIQAVSTGQFDIGGAQTGAILL